MCLGADGGGQDYRAENVGSTSGGAGGRLSVTFQNLCRPSALPKRLCVCVCVCVYSVLRSGVGVGDVSVTDGRNGLNPKP
jgi:hypothetical protein